MFKILHETTVSCAETAVGPRVVATKPQDIGQASRRIPVSNNRTAESLLARLLGQGLFGASKRQDSLGIFSGTNLCVCPPCRWHIARRRPQALFL